ncbi:MAG: class II aldolase/adducin family protein [Christensenella sp.]|nr:class II aldolase/adducin family protein [Christensenella sp.]
MASFFQDHHQTLADYARLSQSAGARCDYVQGGGGNTSAKLDGTLMAVKASGFRLSDVTAENAYAVMDYAAIRAFYGSHEAAEFADAERAGLEQAKAATLSIDGLTPLRPSVEAGFHSLLGTFVVHSHSVYANLACCAVEMKQILTDALAEADFAWGMVPYIDPGARLSFAIRDELKRVERETGKVPAAIFMQNHGLIVHAETADECLLLHDEVNALLARHFGVAPDAFLRLNLAEYISARIRETNDDGAFFLESPLYPDQMVFFIGTLEFGAGEADEGKARLNLNTGELSFAVNEAQAQVLKETLAAVLFIQEQIAKKNNTLSTMGEQAKRFIANWESEKYRKSLVGGKA